MLVKWLLGFTGLACLRNPERTPTGCERLRRQVRAPLEPAEPAAVADPRLEGKFSPDFKLRTLCEALQALSWRRGRLFRTGLLGQSCAADEFVCSREKPLRNGPPEITVLWGTPLSGTQPVLCLKLRWLLMCISH